MDKRHKITAAVSAGALLVVLAVGGIAYSNVHKSNKPVNSTKVTAAKVQPAKPVVTPAQTQAQLEAVKLSKVYEECLAQAQKLKESASVCAD